MALSHYGILSTRPGTRLSKVLPPNGGASKVSSRADSRATCCTLETNLDEDDAWSRVGRARLRLGASPGTNSTIAVGAGRRPAAPPRVARAIFASIIRSESLRLPRPPRGRIRSPGRRARSTSGQAIRSASNSAAGGAPSGRARAPPLRARRARPPRASGRSPGSRRSTTGAGAAPVRRRATPADGPRLHPMRPYDTSTRRPPATSTARRAARVEASRATVAAARRDSDDTSPAPAARAGAASAARGRRERRAAPPPRAGSPPPAPAGSGGGCAHARSATSALDGSSTNGMLRRREVADESRARVTSSSGRTNGVPAVRDPRKPCEAGAAHDAEEDGLGLIVGLVAEGHAARAALGGQRRQRAEARLAARRPAGTRRAAPRAPPRRRHASAGERQRRAPRRARGPASAPGRRLGAQAVVDARHLQRQPQPPAQLPQGVQERHRIGSARHRDDRPDRRARTGDRARRWSARTVDSMRGELSAIDGCAMVPDRPRPPDDRPTSSPSRRTARELGRGARASAAPTRCSARRTSRRRSARLPGDELYYVLHEIGLARTAAICSPAPTAEQLQVVLDFAALGARSDRPR